MHCKHCGHKVLDEAVICPSCGCELKEKVQVGKSKWVAWILSLFFGGWGIHRFYMGNPMIGIIYLLINLGGICCTAGVLNLFFYLYLIVEGIYIITRNDEDFQNMCGKQGDL